MKKAMISQPMGGVSEEEIKRTKEMAENALKHMGYEVVNTYFEEDPPEDVNQPIYHLGKSIEKMAECDAVYFCKGWEDRRGCIIENSVAKIYGLEIYQG